MHHRSCALPECSNEFDARDSRQVCCGPRCKKLKHLAGLREKNRQAALVQCTHCSGPMSTSLATHARYCTDDCRRNAANERNRRPKRMMQCTRCEAEIELRGSRKYCPDCSIIALREARYRCRVSYKHQLRLVKFETFDPLEIHERDGWMCSLCESPIDPLLQYPDPLSPSIDHVIPVSTGGTHERSNVASAHLVCNLRKGNRAAA